jgi:DNA-binding protein H-NS
MTLSKVFQMSTNKLDLEAMSVDELWSLHEKISHILSVRITSEKQELEKRLAALNRGRNVMDLHPEEDSDGEDRVRRKYPRVLPKFQNPATPTEIWSGRGKQPRWLVAAIKSGRKIDDFRISDAARAKEQRRHA